MQRYLFAKRSYLMTLASVLLLGSACSTSSTATARAPSSTPLLQKHLESIDFPPAGVHLRAGYVAETAPLKACVLYLQGLNDSILDHDPYFRVLSQAGYRIIFYDYLGQGASGGSMNDSRIAVPRPFEETEVTKRNYELHDKYFAIPEQGEFIWNRFKHVKNDQGVDCAHSKKLVIGWSTGGLAGYRLAHEKKADAVVLLAPELHPKSIPLRTLTGFSANLKTMSMKAAKWKIDPHVQGLVLLTGSQDRFVDGPATQKTLAENAPQFRVKSYPGALHALDRELPEVAEDVRHQTVQFFDQVTGSIQR